MVFSIQLSLFAVREHVAIASGQRWVDDSRWWARHGDLSRALPGKHKTRGLPRVL
jgi:hypothetical protein